MCLPGLAWQDPAPLQAEALQNSRPKPDYRVGNPDPKAAAAVLELNFHDISP